MFLLSFSKKTLVFRFSNILTYEAEETYLRATTPKISAGGNAAGWRPAGGWLASRWRLAGVPLAPRWAAVLVVLKILVNLTVAPFFGPKLSRK